MKPDDERCVKMLAEDLHLKTTLKKIVMNNLRPYTRQRNVEYKMVYYCLRNVSIMGVRRDWRGGTLAPTP